MVSKKTAKKKAPVRKRGRNILKNVGKGPNININIDQSKRSTKKSIGQTSQPRQPSVISTFTPVMGPPSFIPFPIPTPNLNPFDNVVKETQKAKIKEEPNGLEKPKPKEKEDVVEDPNVSFLNKKEKRENESMGSEDFDVPENMAKKEEKIRRRNKGKTAAQPDLSESSWFNPSRETDTPLEEQTKTEKKKTILDLAIYSDKYERPKVREGRSGIMTMNELIRPALEEENRRRDFQAFMSGGQRLGGDTIMDRLSQEELRRRRIDILDKDKKPLLITSEQPHSGSWSFQDEPSEAANVIEGEAQEGLKTESMKKQEEVINAYRESLLDLSFQGLKKEATKQGIKYEKKGTTKDILFNKLIDNFKTKN